MDGRGWPYGVGSQQPSAPGEVPAETTDMSLSQIEARHRRH